MHNTVTVSTNLHCLIYNCANCHFFPYIFWYQLTLKNISWGYTQHKGFSPLTEYQQVGWKLIKEENLDNKNYKRYTHSWNWFYFLMKFKHDGQNFLSFWTVFCPFTPLTTWKIKILKNWKKVWRYHHFTQVYQKSWSYPILFLRYGV